MLALLLSKISLKDWVYGGLIVALLAFGVWEYHHIEQVGAAKQVAVYAAAEKANDVKVAAINASNQKVEDTANAQVQALSGALASANADLAKRVHDDTSSNSPEFMPETSCTASQPANAGAAPSGGSAPQSAAQPARVSADKQVIIDDLTIALDHNLQLQAIITEFQRVIGTPPTT